VGEMEVMVVVGEWWFNRERSQEERPAQLPDGRFEPMRIVMDLVGDVTVDVIFALFDDCMRGSFVE